MLKCLDKPMQQTLVEHPNTKEGFDAFGCGDDEAGDRPF
jgi:hypothetical protein